MNEVQGPIFQKGWLSQFQKQLLEWREGEHENGVYEWD